MEPIQGSKIDGILDDMNDLDFRLTSMFSNYGGAAEGYRRRADYEPIKRKRKVEKVEKVKPNWKSKSEFAKAVKKYTKKFERDDRSKDISVKGKIARSPKIEFEEKYKSSKKRPSAQVNDLYSTKEIGSRRMSKSRSRSRNMRRPEVEFRDQMERQRPADTYFKKIYKRSRSPMDRTASSLYKSRPKFKSKGLVNF